MWTCFILLRLTTLVCNLTSFVLKSYFLVSLMLMPVYQKKKKKLIIHESNILEGTLAMKFEFEDQMIDKVEKIGPRDLVILNNPTWISHIKFVIPNEFKDMGCKTLLFLVIA